MASETSDLYGYIPDHRAPPPFDRYQITLLGDRGRYVWQLAEVIIWKWKSRESTVHCRLKGDCHMSCKALTVIFCNLGVGHELDPSTGWVGSDRIFRIYSAWSWALVFSFSHNPRNKIYYLNSTKEYKIMLRIAYLLNIKKLWCWV